MNKRIKSALIVIVMLVCCLSNVSTASAAEVKVDGYWITDGRNNTHNQDPCENSNYDIRGNDRASGKPIGTTFDFYAGSLDACAGYSTILSVDGSESFIQNKGSAVVHNGISISTTFTQVENGKALQVKYTVHNTTGQQHTIGIATTADLMMNQDDWAACNLLYGKDGTIRGFTLNSGGYYSHYVVRQSRYVTDVDTLYLGDWMSDRQGRYNNRWTDRPINLGSGADACFSISWKNRTIAPNTTQEYSYLIGMVHGWDYNILYHGNGGTLPNGGTQHWETYEGDKTYNYIENPFIRDGYEFVGWGTSSTATSGVTSSNTFINAASSGGYKELWAIWKRSVFRQQIKVRYENADGTFTSYTNEYDENHKIGDVVTWSRPADSTYKAVDEISYTVDGDKTTEVTVYRKQFKVNLSVGIGVSSVSGTGTYRVGQGVTIDAVVKEGYTWKDWTGTYNVTNKKYVFNMPSGEVTMRANAEDITPPIVTLEQSPTAWTKGDVTLTVTASDKGSGLDSKPYSWNNGSTWVDVKTSVVDKNGTYSVKARDKAGNIGSASITVTNIDKLPPIINGLEAFMGLGEIDRNEGVKTVDVSITDISNNDYGASGVKGGELIVTNSDNGLTKTWSIGSDGKVSVNITNKDTTELSELFYGNFRVTVEAEDNVGNISRKEFDTTEYTLDSELVHADNYKSNLFIRGETGIFIFYAGGYPDEVRVYFPTDAGLIKDYSKIFYYKKQNAIEVGMIPFYVPLDAIKGDYTIYVESYKNGKLLQTKSQAFEIGLETVLNELRTKMNK